MSRFPIPSPSEILEALRRIQGSESFATSARLSEFLHYVVRAGVQSDEPLKETTIGVDLLKRPPDYDPKSDSIVRTQARRVRERLDLYYRTEGLNDPVLIRIPKGGYLPVFAYRKLHENEAPAADPLVAAGPRTRWDTIVLWAAAVIVLVAAVSLIIKAFDRTPPGDVHIVVLPFQATEPSSENELYGQAIANAIVASLTKTDNFHVVSLPKPPSGDSPNIQLQEQLTAYSHKDFVVSGHLERTKGTSSIIAKLVRLSDGGVIWSQRFVLDWRDLMKVEEQIGQTVSARLAAHLGQTDGHESRRIPAANVEADREYLNGSYAAVITRQTAKFASFDVARRHLERTIELDPNYANAHATLALLMAFRVVPWKPGNEVYLEGAERHAKRALELMRNHPEALAAMARTSIVRRDLKVAWGYATRAVESEPASADAHSSLADVCNAMGFYESALQSYQRASERTFVAMEPYAFGSYAAARLGRAKDAELFLKAYAEVDAESPVPTSIRGTVLTRLGRAAEGEPILRRTVKAIDDAALAAGGVLKGEYDFARIALALSLVRLGRKDEAEAQMAQVNGPFPRRVEDEILLHAALGHKEQALRAIRESYDYRNYRFLVTQPDLRILYNEPEFRRLVENAYREWTSHLSDYSALLPEQPPALPDPAAFFRGVSR